MDKSVKISSKDYQAIKTLAKAEHRTLRAILKLAIRTYSETKVKECSQFS